MGSPIDIFVCYAHEDEEHRRRLEKQLQSFQRKGLIRVWHDRAINPGEAWKEEIHAHLNTAQIVLLLVSPDFMASDYCYSVEMNEALKRHANEEVRVIPIIVRPVHWKEGPLGNLQALPQDALPITEWHNLDSAFFNVAEGIQAVLKELTTSSSPGDAFLALQDPVALNQQPSSFPHSTERRDTNQTRFLTRLHTDFPIPTCTRSSIGAIHLTLVSGGGLSLMIDHSALFKELLAVVEADN